MTILARRLTHVLADRKQSSRPDLGFMRKHSSGHSRSRGAGHLLAHQLFYNLLALGRNRRALFASMILPVVFLVLFATVFGNERVGPDHVRSATYYLPEIAALGVIVCSFSNLVAAIIAQRETGILKRRRATPVPAWVLIIAQALTAMVASIAVVALVVIVGRLGYGVAVPTATLPEMLLVTLIGSAALSCLAYALASIITSIESVQSTLQAIVLPLYFISGVFIPNPNLTPALRDVARALPVEHLAAGLQHAISNTPGMPWTDLAVTGAWAVAGLLIGLRRFTWTPSTAMA